MPSHDLLMYYQRAWGRAYEPPQPQILPTLSRNAEFQASFSRTQSLKQMQMEWESRLPPMQTYWGEIATVIGFVLFLVIVVVGTHL